MKRVQHVPGTDKNVSNTKLQREDNAWTFFVAATMVSRHSLDSIDRCVASASTVTDFLLRPLWEAGV